MVRTEERTFVAVKPDGVQRGLVGEIIRRFEAKGYKITALKMLQVTDAQAKAHYAEHEGKPFYPRLIRYIQSGPIVAMVVEGYNAVAGVRHLMGATDPNKAEVGTIRADFAEVMEYNVVHGSDSVESAEREIKIYFDENEIFANRKCMAELVVEYLDAD
ncbi:nucleoside-diphosphate kinase [bacterium]|nr:nucleoside-diphosphate kinase [bacterium]